MESYNQESHGVVVIMVPFPCQSHLNQLLHLSCLISSYKIPTHYACFSTYVEQAKLRFNDKNNPQLSQIHFHEFLTPPIESPPPNPDSLDKFPSHLQPSFDSSLLLREPLRKLLREISASSRRVIIIHDTVMSYAIQDFTSIQNVESYVFNPVSAFHSYWRSKNGYREGCTSPEFQKLINLQLSFQGSKSGTILNSCRAIEGDYIDLLAKMDINTNNRIWAIGPFNIGKEHDEEKSKVRHKCLEWLDKQEPRSVIYVSFGTTVSMTFEELKELALGLEQSGQKFIWVLRDADKGNALDQGKDRIIDLPKGYEERVKHNGMVVREWVPQIEILRHPSTGGFMSHCGWNSCLESISTGVPMVAWPMHSDQPNNAVLVTDVLKIGIAIMNWENRNELVTCSTITKAVKCLIASKEGDEMRNRVEKLGCAVREAVENGGASILEFESFISHITK